MPCLTKYLTRTNYQLLKFFVGYVGGGVEGLGEIWAGRGFATADFFLSQPYLSYGSVVALYSRSAYLYFL